MAVLAKRSKLGQLNGYPLGYTGAILLYMITAYHGILEPKPVAADGVL